MTTSMMMMTMMIVMVRLWMAIVKEVLMRDVIGTSGRSLGCFLIYFSFTIEQIHC